MKDKVILVDDIITTGSHFKACKSIIKKEFPEVEGQGLFIARRVFY